MDFYGGIKCETFRSIVENMGKGPSTISKEIKRNRIMHPTSVKSDYTDFPLLKKLLMSVTTRFSHTKN